MSLVPTKETQPKQIAQERINEFIFSFFSNLKSLNANKNIFKPLWTFDYSQRNKFNTIFDVFVKNGNQNYQELDEKVYSALVWLVLQLIDSKNEQDKKKVSFLPILINDFIQAPNLRLRGKPSAVFLHPKGKVMIFSQNYQPILPHTSDLEILQAAIHAKILTEMGFIVDRFLCVNYYSMSLICRKFNQKDFNELDKLLSHFQLCIEEHEFVPPKSPPCPSCEFSRIC
ncbi:MAG: hypothetical protein ACFFDN_51640 [Candidatus Hodarchaeota archaeon]